MSKPKFTIQPVQSSKPVGSIDRELMTKTTDDGVYPLAMAKEIRIDRLRPDPNQPRHSFNQERLEELADSIREQGILQPIIVEYIDEDDYFRILHGERRWRASQMVGLTSLPAIIHKVDDSNRLVRQLIENIQREDLNDIDRALALKQLKIDLGLPSWEVVAQKVGISKRRILQLVDTTKLPESVQQDIRSGKLTEKHGRAIKKLPAEEQENFAKTLREMELSGDESLEVAKFITANPTIPVVEAIVQVKKPSIKKDQPSLMPPAQQMQPKPDTEGVAIGSIEPLSTPENVALSALTDIKSLSSLLDSLSPSNYDAVRIETLLREIIVQSKILLSRLASSYDVSPLLDTEDDRFTEAGESWDGGLQ